MQKFFTSALLQKMGYKIVNKMTVSAFFFACAALSSPLCAQKNTLNIYNWANSITQEILNQFTKETGIKVNMDVYDNADLMEAKMLAGSSGFDMVFVTASPYLERQIKLGLYQPLDFQKISNSEGLNPQIMSYLEKADHQNAHSVPYIWGTTGIGANKTQILRLAPDIDLDTFGLFFTEELVSQIAPCGVELMDTPNEVFPLVLSYLGIDPNSTSIEDLRAAEKVLTRAKPYIQKFNPSSTLRSLSMGEACLVQGWSGDVLQAQDRATEAGLTDEIIYIIPKEGGYIWIDAMAIPADAPHPEWAHAFINFLLRPEIMAQITTTLKTANAVPASKQHMPKSIVDNNMIYPPEKIMKKLYVDIIQTAEYERFRSREWTRVKTGR